MANWVYVENGQIIEYHDLLPKNWRHVSGLDLSLDNLEFLKSLGWYKVIQNHTEYDNNQYKLNGFNYSLQEDFVIETSDLILITQEEKDLALNYNKYSFLHDLRRRRNELLSLSDWTQLQDVIDSHSEQWNETWKLYRQSLRDLPQVYQDKDPCPINWPPIPFNY